DVASAAFGVDAACFADRDIAGSCRFDITGLDKENRSTRLSVHQAADIAGAYATGFRIELRVAANVADLNRSALAAQFGIATDVSGFDTAALRGDGRAAFGIGSRC